MVVFVVAVVSFKSWLLLFLFWFSSSSDDDGGGGGDCGCVDWVMQELEWTSEIE